MPWDKGAMKMNPDMMPIMVASVDINNKNIKEASNIVKKDIIPSFERIDGVASVDAIGVIEESVKVTLDYSKIEKLNNKLKSSIDSKMKSSQDELNKAKNEIAKGKAELKNQSEDKNLLKEVSMRDLRYSYVNTLEMSGSSHEQWDRQKQM